MERDGEGVPLKVAPPPPPPRFAAIEAVGTGEVVPPPFQGVGLPLLLPPPSLPAALRALTVGTFPLGVPVKLLKVVSLEVTEAVEETLWEGVLLL